MKNKTIIQFTILTFVIAIISWGICIFSAQLGVRMENAYWLYVPFLIGGFSPTIASYITLKKNNEISGLKEWMKTVFGFKKPLRFYLLVLMLSAVYFIPQVFINGTEEMNPLYLLIVLPPFMLLGGGLEEAGWRYILQPELDKKCGYFLSSAIVSVIWSVWHLPLFFVPGTSQYVSNFWFFAISVIGFTFALGAIHRISKSVFLCVLYHCISNAGSITFNIPDTLFANSVTTVLLIAVSAMAVFVYEKGKNKIV